MTTITLIRPDDTVEVTYTTDARSWVVDNIPGCPVLLPDWRVYGDRPCQVWYGHGGEDINLDASALYLLSCAPNMANAQEYYLFGPVAIVQE